MKKAVLMLTAAFLLVSCGARLPSPQTAHRVVEKHFKKYGKKYKESDFGRHRLEKVEISSIQETQKGMSSVEAFTFLEGGSVYQVRVTLQKKPFGWRPLAWETLGAR